MEGAFRYATSSVWCTIHFRRMKFSSRFAVASRVQPVV
jgi:hypothetical protein